MEHIFNRLLDFTEGKITKSTFREKFLLAAKKVQGGNKLTIEFSNIKNPFISSLIHGLQEGSDIPIEKTNNEPSIFIWHNQNEKQCTTYGKYTFTVTSKYKKIYKNSGVDFVPQITSKDWNCITFNEYDSVNNHLYRYLLEEVGNELRLVGSHISGTSNYVRKTYVRKTIRTI